MTLPAVPLALFDFLGGSEMILIMLVTLMLFGGEKLPGVARSIGKVMREFRKAASDVEDEFKRALDEDDRKKAAEEFAKKYPPSPPTPTPAPHLIETPPEPEPFDSPPPEPRPPDSTPSESTPSEPTSSEPTPTEPAPLPADPAAPRRDS